MGLDVRRQMRVWRDVEAVERLKDVLVSKRAVGWFIGGVNRPGGIASCYRSLILITHDLAVEEPRLAQPCVFVGKTPR